MPSCVAISEVTPNREDIRRLIKEYDSLFAPTLWDANTVWAWGLLWGFPEKSGVTWVADPDAILRGPDGANKKDILDCRVLALLFMAEIAENEEC